MLRQRVKTAPCNTTRTTQPKKQSKKLHTRSFTSITDYKKHKQFSTCSIGTQKLQQDEDIDMNTAFSPEFLNISPSSGFKRSIKLYSMPMVGDFDKNLSKHAATHKTRLFEETSDEEQYETLKAKKAAKVIEPDFADYTQARQTYAAMESGKLDTSPDNKFGFLDPFNPPNLDYSKHVKLLKNIDYSPLIRRANEGGMFTVEDVITILQKDGVTDQFKSAMRREHLQDPFIFEQTYDVFNNGKKPCPLCLPDPTEEQINRIHYTNVNLLRKYISTSGMIIPRRVSGVCQMHQKKLRYAIKNAKQLALLSMTSNWHVPLSYVYPEKYPAYEDQNAAADVERERRMEIKELYDNLVSDKLAMMEGKSQEEIDAAKSAESAEEQEIKQLHEAATKEAQAQQVVARIKQLAAHYEELKAKSPEQAEELDKQFEIEKSNIESDIAQENVNIQQLKGDFGELQNLDKFDINTSFDEFVTKYNRMIKEKGIRTLDYNQLFINDSDQDNEEPSERIKRIQVENLELDKKLQKEADTMGLSLQDYKM